MLFILLLILAAAAIAGSAAFFSVYGLAYTFGGVFWSVVFMGSSLEIGKLVAASFLYRYWNDTGKALKVYLIAGVIALMLMTSTGIFGYLSSGYQTESVPLKQIDAQVRILESEKDRKIARKEEIDKQIAKLPDTYITGRIRLIDQFKQEQQNVTARIDTIDKDILQLKSQQIKTEAHVGPIVYIARAFDTDTDNATKYLLMLIIFAFDPMAVALTLAVNIAFRKREEELKQKEHPLQQFISEQKPLEPTFAKVVDENFWDLMDGGANKAEEMKPEPIVNPVEQRKPEPKVEVGVVVPDLDPNKLPHAPIKTEPKKNFDTKPHVVGEVRTMHSPRIIQTPLPKDDPEIAAKITELARFFQELRSKQHLTPEERLEKEALENILRKHGWKENLP